MNPIADTTETETDALPHQSAFECWHFDALSDDGREAIVITFNDNYPFSPRYFRENRNSDSPRVPQKRFPAVTFTYSVDGKIVLRAVNEFLTGEFSSNTDGKECSVGNSSFRLKTTEYGSGYLVELSLLTARKCRIEAEIEWLFIESGIAETVETELTEQIHSQIVAPRSDVSGKITRIGRSNRSRTMYNFRGTGYHDHYGSDRSLERSLDSRWWGRAHFVDSTVIFRCDKAKTTGAIPSKLFLVRDGLIHTRDANVELQNVIRDRYGLTIPGRISLQSEDNIRLRIKPLNSIESGFFKKSVFSEITLMLRDGKPRKTLGIAEFISPGRLRNPIFRWFTDLRIGRNGKWPWF